jgi:hypothetical protein
MGDASDAATLRDMLAKPTKKSLEVKEPEHYEDMPWDFINKIPIREKIILAFILSYFEEGEAETLPIDLVINGGYVRDLLLGGIPDDLDVSVCLRKCHLAVTVGTIIAGLEKYLEKFQTDNPSCRVEAIKSAEILSDESKNKQLDVAKAIFTVEGQKIEVDLMPTIGEETYGTDNRVPIRDERGTLKQDALRRDLTIGALLIKVSFCSEQQDADGGSSGEGDRLLRWELLDFFDGLADLKSKTLRSPYPENKSPQEVYETVLRTKEARQLAEEVQLTDSLNERHGFKLIPQRVDTQGGDRGDAPPPWPPTVVAYPAVCQALWWIKILVDDPLRIVRALRFAAKLDFTLHEEFWIAASFALEQLKTKVSWCIGVTIDASRQLTL